MSLEHCTPSDIPQEIMQYDGDIATNGCWQIWKDWLSRIRVTK